MDSDEDQVWGTGSCAWGGGLGGGPIYRSLVEIRPP